MITEVLRNDYSFEKVNMDGPYYMTPEKALRIYEKLKNKLVVKRRWKGDNNIWSWCTQISGDSQMYSRPTFTQFLDNYGIRLLEGKVTAVDYLKMIGSNMSEMADIQSFLESEDQV